MQGVGQPDKPWIYEKVNGIEGIAPHWRRALTFDEINQMAPTAEVISRPGRP